jgi:2-haloacid dehalogenase
VNRWVSFDCFGTLVDWQAWLTEVLGPLGGPGVESLVRAYHAQERLIERESPQRSYKDVLATALVRATAEAGIRVSHRDARAMLVEGWGAMQLFDDVEAMLGELRSKGYRLAVLTNCDEDLFAMTHRLFATPFDFWLTSERMRGYKPEPWHFRGFELLTRVSRPHWVHVANSWYHDIAPARALGLRHVWLDRERTGEHAGTSIHVYSPLDVAGVVERLVEDDSSLMFRGRSPLAATV